LFANQKFFFCSSVFYQGAEPLLWSQSLDRGAFPVEGYFTFFCKKFAARSVGSCSHVPMLAALFYQQAVETPSSL
jgi:hypothetical protein